jgi:hypothetical protein
VAYAASIEHLLHILHACAPAKVVALALEKRRVRHGLLSVGLKLHCLGDEHLFITLIKALGAESRALNQNVYKSSRAKFCLVLPPVGSAQAAILLLECIEQYTGCQMFNNRNIQLQVCSPGRLNSRNAALHAIGFYLGSDTLRQYALEDFATTVSARYHYRGKRIVIYDAGASGDFDRAFAWWARSAARLTIDPTLPFRDARTDILLGPGSRLDIHNINLLETLIVHAQSSEDGYWSSLGEQFAKDLVSLLDRHLLTGLIEAPWAGIPESDVNDRATDQLFLSALQELTAYAAAEATRLKQARETVLAHFSGQHERDARGGILQEMQELVRTYRAIVTSVSEPHDGDPT